METKYMWSAAAENCHNYKGSKPSFLGNLAFKAGGSLRSIWSGITVRKCMALIWKVSFKNNFFEKCFELKSFHFILHEVLVFGQILLYAVINFLILAMNWPITKFAILKVSRVTEGLAVVIWERSVLEHLKQRVNFCKWMIHGIR